MNDIPTRFKFRAWNNASKQMFLSEEFTEALMSAWNCGSAAGETIENQYDHLEWMQWTGKVDESGRDIYEGDIFRITLEDDEGDEVIYYIVTWLKEWAMFATLDAGEYVNYMDNGIKALDRVDYWTFTIEDVSEYSIIGNIKEHPHKIKGHVYFENL